jgi:predicted dehydrogenase
MTIHTLIDTDVFTFGGRFGEGIGRMFYTSFANAVRGRGDVPVDPWDAVAGLEVLEAAQRSATTGQVVALPVDTA